MLILRMIAPKWLTDKNKDIKKIIEGQFKPKDIKKYNKLGYNIYYLPNHPSSYIEGTTVDGSQVDTFKYVFVDMDLKDGVYASKDQFIEQINTIDILPTKIVDSGGGVHIYWKVKDLDAKSYLRLTRRLMRLFRTDSATCNIFQLMRLPGYYNTKDPNDLKLCDLQFESDAEYTCDELNRLLPPILAEDEQFCEQHYERTFNIDKNNLSVSDTIPPKFGKLIRENHEVKELWSTISDDRSKSDYRLGHIMFASQFTRDEAASVLINSAKALERAPVHRQNYALNIIDKIWSVEPESKIALSSSIRDLLNRPSAAIKGIPLRCHKRVDNTEHGFRLGQVLGLVAGSGVGKTAYALNMFNWFAEQNPDYHHFFIPLEQPANEIADRWQTMAQGNTALYDKVHVMSNYDDDGNFRHLSFDEIREYLQEWQKTNNQKIGCVVIDHIGALKKKGAKDENQDLMTICHNMKAFAIQTNTFLIMQSQTSREKAGIGDLELNKDAAYGTIFFESYCDYLITLWQPLKRCHSDESCPTVTAFKFCKIRHKKAKKDVIKEDVPYYLYFDSEKELLRDMTQDEETSFRYFLPSATNKRKADRKTELVTYQSVPYKDKEDKVETTAVNHSRDSSRH